MRSKMFCVHLLLLLAASLLSAQTAGTGAITGTVTDSSGAVIPNATVTATQTETGQERTATTGADGTYRFSLLPPGLYKVSFTASGFKPVEVPNFNVNVTEAPVLNRSLEVGAQTDQVTVQSEVETVQTNTSTLGTVVGSQSVVGLPLTTRNYTNLLGLSAGAAAAVPNATALGRGNMEIAVNGASTGQNTFQMDGVSVVNFASNGILTEGGTYATFGIPNPDALAEFKIQTSLYDAGYGRNPGANVNVITKSGTNVFHGTAFEFFRNTVLNANDFFRNRFCGLSPLQCATAGGNKLVLNQNQYGGVIGGPVKKDKLFFFTSYQQTWQKNGIASQGFSSANLPPLPLGDRGTCAGFTLSTCDAAGQQFIKGLGAIYSKTATSVGGTQVAADGSNINPIAVRFLQAKLANGSYFLPGSTTGSQQAVNYSNPAHQREYQGLINMDYVISPKHTLISRYFRSMEPQDQGIVGTGTAIVSGTTGSDVFGYHDGVLKLTSIVSNSFVNELRGSFQRATTDFFQSPPPSTFASKIYPSSSIACPGGNLIICSLPFSPVLSFTGLYAAGGSSSADEIVHNTQKQISDQISWTKGKHTVRAGFEFDRSHWVFDYPGLGHGINAFQTFQDFLIGLPGNCGAAVPGVCNGGNGSSILNTTNFDVQSDGFIHGFPVNNASWFVQDDIKVTQRLTVNVGLRWEYDGQLSEKYGMMSTVWTSLVQAGPVPATTQVPVPGQYLVPAGGSYAGWIVASNYDTRTYGPLPNGVARSDQNIPTRNSVPLTNYAPRLGFAWQPFGGSKFVVRGGGGIFYDRVPANTIVHGVGQNAPYAITLDQSGVGNSFASLAAPFQNIPKTFPIRWVNFTPGLTPFQQSSGITVTGLQDFFTPVSYSWNLNMQYEILPRLVLEVGYVGAHGIHQGEVAHLLNEAGLATATNPINGITTNTTSNVALRVPYLGFSATGIQYSMSDTDYKFNSLQTTLRKQLSHGLTFQGAYTFSRAFATAQQSGQNSGDPLNTRQQYGLNNQYRPHRFVLNYSWEIPGSSLKGFAGKAIGGWNLSGVTTIQDGTPMNITDNRGGSIFGMSGSGQVISRAQMASGATYADIVNPGDVKTLLGGASGGPGYFNAAAFTAIPLAIAPDGKVTNGTGWGNSGVGIAFGPGQFNFDATLAKVTRVGGIHEDANLQFRAEFFNIFNHPQFSNPATAFNNLGSFGQITSTSVNPRLVQLALKYVF